MKRRLTSDEQYEGERQGDDPQYPLPTALWEGKDWFVIIIIWWLHCKCKSEVSKCPFQNKGKKSSLCWYKSPIQCLSVEQGYLICLMLISCRISLQELPLGRKKVPVKEKISFAHLQSKRLLGVHSILMTSHLTNQMYKYIYWTQSVTVWQWSEINYYVNNW